MNILYEYSQFLSRYAKSTQKTYLENVRLYLKFLEEYTEKENTVIQICNVDKSDIYNYVAYLDKFSRNTKENRLASVKNFYVFLNSNLSCFLFEDIKLFNTNKKLPKTLNSVQIQALLNYYSNKRNKLIIYLFLSTGIRLSELSSIEIEKINFDKKCFNVKVKGGDSRDVFLNQHCVDMIKDYIGDRKEGKLFDIKNRAIQTIVKKAMKELDIEGSAHTLRHTFATVMYKHTKDILLVSELLHHKSILSTQIYTHIENEELRKAFNANPLAHFGVEDDTN